MENLDYYDMLPSGLKEYLSEYGHHFSKNMCKWAVSRMRDRNGKKVEMRSKEQVLSAMKNYGIELQNDKGYDAVFVYHMGLSDFYGSSIPNDSGVSQYVKDVLDDRDGYDGIAFCRFIADCNATGTPIIWEDML